MERLVSTLSDKFIPLSKQSKQKQKAFYMSKRSTWGDLNPVTRKPPNPKAYNRVKSGARTSLLIHDRENED
jgi:hypothetical protein